MSACGAMTFNPDTLERTTEEVVEEPETDSNI